MLQKSLKVLHIITRLDQGGSAEMVAAICGQIDRSKFEPMLVYGRSRTDALNPDFKCPVAYVPSLVRSISPLSDARALFEIGWAIRTLKPDIVHTHSSKAGIIGRWAARLAGIKTASVIHSPHGHIYYGYEFSGLQTRLFLAAERITAGITGKFTALTKGEKDESLSFGVGKPEQWTVIHTGVDMEPASRDEGAAARRELGIPGDSVVVGTVARFEHVKGVRFLAQAAGRVPASPRGPYFLFVGDGSSRSLLERSTREAGVSSRCIFTGMRGDVARMMAAMDIYVQPSLNEGMGKTIVQALYSGLPVIATRVQGIPDLVRDGDNGILVPPGDAIAIAAAIGALIGQPALRRAMGERGKAWVNGTADGMPQFSMERAIRLLERLYASLGA